MAEQRSNGGTAPPLGGLFGTGRSGSTWLGAIVNAHPDVAYRFEPFHRLRHDAKIVEASKLLDSEQLDNDALWIVYKRLLVANPLLEKPPFFPKSHSRLPGKWLAWQVSAKVSKLHPLFEWAYSPRSQPPVVFKEVTKERTMANALARTDMRAVYLVRHPGGVIASELRGHEKGVMPAGRYNVVASALEEHDRELAEQYAGRVDTLSDLQKSALLWRIDVERGIEAAQSDAKAMIIIYEDLCAEPHSITRAMLAHLGFDYHPQVDDFLRLSTSPNGAGRLKTWEWSINRYFSVFRDPLESAHKWKKQLSEQDKAAIREIVEPSAAYRACATSENWSW